MRVQRKADRIGQDQVMFLDVVLKLRDFIFRFWNAGNHQTKTCNVSLK